MGNIRDLLYIGVILFGCMYISMSNAEVCGGLECYEHSCCVDQRNGAQCFRASEHTCVQGTQGNKLCGAGEGACGVHPEQYCYNATLYDCSEGRLILKGDTGNPTTSAPTTAPTPSNTPAPPSSTLGSSSGNVCGNANCGSDSCCLLLSGEGACYKSDQYTCSQGVLCPAGYQSCGGNACFLSSQYNCVDGKLQQKPSSSTSSTSSSPSTPPPSSSSTGGSATTGSTTTTPTTAPTTGSSTGGGSGSQAVKLYGLNYSAKLPSGACPSFADVESDMRILATLTTRIRIYSIAECNQAELIIRAIKSTGVELTLTLGIWLDQGHVSEYSTEMGALTNVISNVGLELVDAIIVGSETLYRNNLQVPELAGYLQNTSSFLSSRGYDDIDVVTADVIYKLIGSDIVNYEDAVYANQFPFWEGVRVEDAVALVVRTLESLRASVGSGKKIVIGETGWPTAGSVFGGNAVPSEANLEIYLHAIVCELHKLNIGYFLFEAFDEPYKNYENENAAERHWGLFTSDRKKKAGITLPVVCAV